MKNWIDVAGLEDIPRQKARLVRTGYHKLALFRTETDEVFAVEDACPHMHGPLSQGTVHDRSVTCPCHNWKIDLASGKVLGSEGGATRTFQTRVRSGRIFLSI